MTSADRHQPEQAENWRSGWRYGDSAGATGEPPGTRAADVTGEFRESMSAEATAADGPPGGGSPVGASPPPKRRAPRSWWIEFPVLLCLALVLALIIKSFVIQAFFIPSSSMENTLDIGDKVLVNKFVYHFPPTARGDTLVLNDTVPSAPIPIDGGPP